MTVSDQTYPDTMSSLDAVTARFEGKKSDFKEHYATNLNLHLSAEKAFRNLISQLVESQGVEQPKVISRLKKRDECLKKFTIKYRNEAEKREDYTIQEFITDLIGVRVVCLYENDIPIIEHLIHKNFKILSVTDKTQILLTDIRAFGYKGLHLDIELTEERHDLPEYLRFKNLRAEIQIRSIVQDAWSEVEHRLRYKRQAPLTIQRRVVRLAALFELADQEFSALHDETEKLIAEATQEINLNKNDNNERSLDAFSFLSMVKKFHPKYIFEDVAIDGFVDEIKNMHSNFKINEMKQAVEKFRGFVWEYKQVQRKKDININPFTEIRFVLYAYNKQIFCEMLYPNQREAFERWLRLEKGLEI